MSWNNLTSSLPLLALPIPRSKWTPTDLPDHTGKVVVITGGKSNSGNTGIGKETAKALLAKNAKVYLACRSRFRAEAAIADLLLAHPQSKAIFLELDLSNLSSIEKAAKEFLSKETKLHALYNNAGVMMAPISMLTDDGYDVQFGTNVLGHWYFTQLIVPALLAASTPKEKSRVVFVSSVAAYSRTDIDYETLKDSPKRQGMLSGHLYGQSKLGDVMLASEFARQYEDKFVSISVHPGLIQSELQRHIPKIFTWLWDTFIAYSPAQGAVTQLYAGGAPEAEQYNGKYLIPWARPGTMPLNGDDPEACAKLWAWCEEQVAGRARA